MPQMHFQNVTHTASTGLQMANLKRFHQRCVLPALVVRGAQKTPQLNGGQRRINIMPTQLSNPTADQHNAEESDLGEAINAKCTEIRSLLPELKRLVEAFGELHEILDADDRVADFDTWCMHEFGVVPELLLEATDRLQVRQNSAPES